MQVDVQCDILSIPSNGGMSCSSGRVGVGYKGDTCSFTCNTGYKLTSNATRICQNNGNWSNIDIFCTPETGTFNIITLLSYLL